MSNGTLGVFQKLLAAAREAAGRKNYDLAIMYYQQALSIEQNAVDIRRELRAAATRNVKEKGGARWMAFLQGLGVLAKLGFTQNPEQKLNLCEQYLARDPGNVSMLLRLARAARAANYPEAAVAVLEDLRAAHPKNIITLRTLLELYRSRGEIDIAMQVAQAILEVLPGDTEAQYAMRDLSAEKAAQPYAGAKTAREVVRSKDGTRERDLRARSERDIHDEAEAEERIGIIRKHIEESPEDPKNWVSLGDICRQIERWDEAREAYEKAREINPIEYTYTMRLEDLDVARRRIEIRDLERRAHAGEDAATSQLPQLRKELADYRFDCFTRREKQYPTDLKIAFELGRICYELRDWDEAIIRFQRTQYDPENREESRLLLGTAFRMKDEHELALRTFSEALAAIESTIMTGIRKNLLYARAQCHEAMDRLDDALKDYMDIYEKDIAFSDVQECVRALRQKIEQRKG